MEWLRQAPSKPALRRGAHAGVAILLSCALFSASRSFPASCVPPGPPWAVAPGKLAPARKGKRKDSRVDFRIQ